VSALIWPTVKTAPAVTARNVLLAHAVLAASLATVVAAAVASKAVAVVETTAAVVAAASASPSAVAAAATKVAASVAVHSRMAETILSNDLSQADVGNTSAFLFESHVTANLLALKFTSL
jgi:hypothetical protein